MTKVAIITAATRGMGKAVTDRLAADGYALALMARSDDVLELAKQHDALSVKGSITDPDSLSALVSAAMDRHNRIDAVICNTGHAAKGDILELSDDDWHDGLDLLMLNVVRMARLVTPIMKQQGGGSFVNISTFGAIEPDAAFPISSAIRAALGSFAKMYVAQHASSGIRMNNVLPGFVNSYPESPDWLTRIPANRYADVAEIANLVAFLASNKSAYINGQNIRIDGGLTRSL